ncbi:hypothetical protein [Gracilimonas sp.]|uniref:hypothetical protein n=1 Tax=Gracilimonas sp. TaxID=1974203 RepID=UPI003BA97280
MKNFLSIAYWAIIIVLTIACFNLIDSLIELEKSWEIIGTAVLSYSGSRYVVNEFILERLVNWAMKFDSQNIGEAKSRDNFNKNFDERISESQKIINKLGTEAIEFTIFDLSVHLTKSLQNELKEINSNNITFVLWEISMFFSILAYTTRPNISDKDYEDMNNTFGIMAREVGTNDNMDKQTQRKMFDLYLETIHQRVDDYQGGTAQSFCMSLFQNIARVGEIENASFWMNGSPLIYGETLSFIGAIEEADHLYSHQE